MKVRFNLLKCCRGSPFDILTDEGCRTAADGSPTLCERLISFEGTVGSAGQLAGR